MIFGWVTVVASLLPGMCCYFGDQGGHAGLISTGFQTITCAEVCRGRSRVLLLCETPSGEGMARQQHGTVFGYAAPYSILS
jgi:hypothetical protein